MTKTFPVAIVGCGNISQMHFDAYLPHPERIRIVAACDTDPERVNAVCKRDESLQGFTSLEEMIAQASWEVAIVCTPTHVRRPVVEILAKAGKHIFVEKPFADTYQDAQSMVAACKQAGVKLAVNQNFRYHYPFDMARNQIASGSIGSVVSVIHQDLMFRQDSGWRTQLQRHALSVMGVHWFDGFRWILQDEAQSVSCDTRSSAAIQCTGETEATATVRFTRGTLASYTESFSAFRGRTETLILGETGELVLNYDTMSLFDRDHRLTPQHLWENPYRGAHKPKATFINLNLLLEAIEQDNEPANSGNDNLKTIALLEGAYRSAQEHHAIMFHEGLPV
ncbi:MAG TPA: Gfo/Idh/MocA family oxidoreductase [Ktedonobacteraceae bacterium]|nr:Gfo/Idh/MocA family oxidoreductase [Ktedonobacteraceae bacterium]